MATEISSCLNISNVCLNEGSKETKRATLMLSDILPLK